jgi:hypothetical protein
VSQDHWQTLAKYHIKAEPRGTGVGYSDLAADLTEMGLPEPEGSVTVKINRGTFPAWFILTVMKAIGVTALRLE